MLSDMSYSAFDVVVADPDILSHLSRDASCIAWLALAS